MGAQGAASGCLTFFYLRGQPAPAGLLMGAQRESEQRRGEWSVAHHAAKGLEGVALIGVLVPQLCLHKVHPPARVGRIDGQVGAVWVKVDQIAAGHKAGNIADVVAGVEADPAMRQEPQVCTMRTRPLAVQFHCGSTAAPKATRLAQLGAFH